MTNNKHLPSDIDSLTRKDLVEIYHIQVAEHQKMLAQIGELKAENERLKEELLVRLSERDQVNSLGYEARIFKAKYEQMNTINTRLGRERDELVEQVNSLQRSIGRMKDDHADNRIEQLEKMVDWLHAQYPHLSSPVCGLLTSYINQLRQQQQEKGDE